MITTNTEYIKHKNSNSETKIMISFVIPSYKEADSINEVIIKRLGILDEIEKQHSVETELIVVNDGELDDTANQVSKITDPRFKFISYKDNQGKGFAVRLGISKAKGDYVGFIDAGHDISSNAMKTLVSTALSNKKIHIIVGSKKHKDSKLTYTLKRRVYTTGYSIFVRLLTGVKMDDTQVGAKMFSRELVDKVLPKILAKRYAFDIEILSIANKLGYTKHIDIPIEIDFLQDQSSVKILFSDNSIRAMIVETLAVSYRLNILKYYEEKYQSQWKQNLKELKLEVQN